VKRRSGHLTDGSLKVTGFRKRAEGRCFFVFKRVTSVMGEEESENLRTERLGRDNHAFLRPFRKSLVSFELGKGKGTTHRRGQPNPSAKSMK